MPLWHKLLAIIKNRFFGGKVNPERIAVMAMYHDTSEIFTGDLPTPIKYFNSEITHAYKDIEAAAELHLISCSQLNCKRVLHHI